MALSKPSIRAPLHTASVWRDVVVGGGERGDDDGMDRRQNPVRKEGRKSQKRRGEGGAPSISRLSLLCCDRRSAPSFSLSLASFSSLAAARRRRRKRQSRGNHGGGRETPLHASTRTLPPTPAHYTQAQQAPTALKAQVNLEPPLGLEPGEKRPGIG